MKTYPIRMCVLSSCRTYFQPKRSFQRYCSHKCSQRAGDRLSQAEREVRRTTKTARHPKAKYVHEAAADTEPGLCPWCDELLPPRCKTCCGDPECIRAYQRAYRVGRSEIERGGKLVPITCGCGCGAEFTPRDGRHRYVDDRHYQQARARVQREKRAANPKPKGRPRKKGAAVLFGKAAGPKVLVPFPREE